MDMPFLNSTSQTIEYDGAITDGSHYEDVFSQCAYKTELIWVRLRMRSALAHQNCEREVMIQPRNVTVP
jgi:hypothetical protein